jgi:predicted P-loop ATPase
MSEHDLIASTHLTLTPSWHLTPRPGMPGKWLIEIAEMSAMSKGEVIQLKALITRTWERYRPRFGRKEVHQPRQCIFIGTNDEAAWMRDDPGGRRGTGPVRIGQIDIEALA